MKKTISITLIILGMVLLSLPYLSELVIKYRVESKRDLLKEIPVEEIQENESREAEYDFDSIRDVEVGSMASGINDFDNRAIIGQIIVPKLNIDLPILKGTTNANLLVGATTMKEEQEMGTGNYSLAGHYMKDKNLLFGGLLDIESGTIVKVTDKSLVYVYRIYDTELVEETDTYMIEDEIAENKGKPVISLMSCYYTSKNGKRFFATGELIDTYYYNEDNFKSSYNED
ncbi:MAG TPA: class A sortase [Tissierellaceae bacterium]|nr:class A sortase [Tissierellaceae bacterium]